MREFKDRVQLRSVQHLSAQFSLPAFHCGSLADGMAGFLRIEARFINGQDARLRQRFPQSRLRPGPWGAKAAKADCRRKEIGFFSRCPRHETFKSTSKVRIEWCSARKSFASKLLWETIEVLAMPEASYLDVDLITAMILVWHPTPPWLGLHIRS